MNKPQALLSLLQRGTIMTLKQRGILIALTLAALIATACRAAAGDPGPGRFGPGGSGSAPFGGGQLANPPTPAAPDTAAQELIEVPAFAQREVDPAPELDLAEFFGAQAAGVAVSTGAAEPTSTASPAVSAGAPAPDQYVSPLLVPPTPVAPPPAAVVQNSPVTIVGGRNTATCVIPGTGACPATMNAGTDVHLTWTFAVDSAESFEWWEAQIVITRNGETYAVHSARNGLDPVVRDPESTAKWTLAVGQSAEFRAGLDDLEPGIYAAYLRLCLGGEPCGAGGAWTDVGGDTLHFLVVAP